LKEDVLGRSGFPSTDDFPPAPELYPARGPAVKVGLVRTGVLHSTMVARVKRSPAHVVVLPRVPSSSFLHSRAETARRLAC
jgi:hypothetical protein